MLFIILLLTTFSAHAIELWHGKNIATLVFIKEPVVDLFDTFTTKENISAAGTGPHGAGCSRSHQGLAHEVFTLVSRKGDFLRIAYDGLMYGVDAKTKQPLNTFWVHKKHLVFFSQLPEETLLNIPGPARSVTNTLILRLPWGNYSLGTRFVHAPEHDTAATYGAYAYHPRKKTFVTLNIAKNLVRQETPLSKTEQRNYFVRLAYEVLAYVRSKGKDRVIPYVWGGSSFVHTYKDGFYEKNRCWERDGNANPYLGYDCSELVFRLAQVSGISYKSKTTVMIEKLLRHVQKNDRLEAGDLIRFPGHVVIIGNIARNEVIEARGYGGGYGKVQKLPLSRYFQGISTFAELRRAYHEKKPLILLNKQGCEQEFIKEVQLIKLV